MGRFRPPWHRHGGGGFPEAQGLDLATRISLLQGYVDAVLFRDIVERFGVTQVAALRWVTRHALRSPCGSFSVNRLYHDLRSQGDTIGKAAVHDLLGHFVDAFLMAAVPVATESERHRNTNPRKLYPVDPGLIRAFDSGGRSNVGHALELVVFNELQRRGADVAYVKTKGDLEVDFLARFPIGDEELIQVCADTADSGTLSRELASLDSAGREHPRAAKKLVVMDAPNTVRHGPCCPCRSRTGFSLSLV
jgi:predicted AAA+ superfamily ATPase